MVGGPVSMNNHFSSLLSPSHAAREISRALSFRSDPSGSLPSPICCCGKHRPGGWLGCRHLLGRKGSSPHRPWRFLLEPSPASPRYLKNVLVIFSVQHSRDGCQGNARLNLHGHQRVCKLGAKRRVSVRFPVNRGQESAAQGEGLGGHAGMDGEKPKVVQ